MDDKKEVEIEKKKKPEKFSQEWYTRALVWLLLTAIFFGFLAVIFPKYRDYIFTICIIEFFCIGLIFIIKPLTMISLNINFYKFLVGKQVYENNPKYELETYNTRFRKIFGRFMGICWVIISGGMLVGVILMTIDIIFN